MPASILRASLARPLLCVATLALAAPSALADSPDYASEVLPPLRTHAPTTSGATTSASDTQGRPVRVGPSTTQPAPERTATSTTTTTSEGITDVIRRAVAVGDCATVIARTEGAKDARSALVRGRCQVRLGEHQAALFTLADVEGGILGEIAALERARALVALDRQEDALRALEGRSLPGRDGLELRLVRGRALVALGRSLDARPDLRELLSTEVADEARFWLAVGGRDRGDRAPAVATFRRVWIDSTRGPWAERAAEELALLGEPVPRVDTPEGRSLVKARIATLDKAYRFGDALELRRALHEVEPMGALDMARATFKGRDYPASIAWYRKALGAPDQASGGARELFDYALATSRTGDYDTAATLYRRLIAQHPDDRLADSASYKLGYLHADRHEWTEATEQLTVHLQRFPDSQHLDEALWWIGWGAWLEERDEAALAAWSRLRRERPRSSLVAGTHYWTARTHGRAGDADAERAGLESVISSYPASGYAWFAAERLGASHPRRPEARRPDWPASLASLPAVQEADTLLAIGLHDLAREKLLPLRDRVGNDRSARLALAWALIESGAYREGRALARPHCTSPWKEGDPLAQQACTPRPAADVVRATAARVDVPDLVPYGIMTTESALDPSVTSIAGARGLMQLMPDEAEGIHGTLYGERPYHPDLLFSAPYNASLGVAELGEKQAALGDVLDGPDIVAAIAAYNGGESAVLRWVEANGGHPEADVFAEQIGYTETRRYVRKVLGTVMVYRYVYGDAEPVAR